MSKSDDLASSADIDVEAVGYLPGHAFPSGVMWPSKACAYDHGIDRGQVLDVLAVELRDKLLAIQR